MIDPLSCAHALKTVALNEHFHFVATLGRREYDGPQLHESLEFVALDEIVQRHDVGLDVEVFVGHTRHDRLALLLLRHLALELSLGLVLGALLLRHPLLGRHQDTTHVRATEILEGLPLLSLRHPGCGGRRSRPRRWLWYVHSPS